MTMPKENQKIYHTPYELANILTLNVGNNYVRIDTRVGQVSFAPPSKNAALIFRVGLGIGFVLMFICNPLVATFIHTKIYLLFSGIGVALGVLTGIVYTILETRRLNKGDLVFTLLETKEQYFNLISSVPRKKSILTPSTPSNTVQTPGKALVVQIIMLIAIGGIIAMMPTITYFHSIPWSSNFLVLLFVWMLSSSVVISNPIKLLIAQGILKEKFGSLSNYEKNK